MEKYKIAVIAGDGIGPKVIEEGKILLKIRKGCERVIRYAYELAKKEGKSLTNISKANALGYSMVFWNEIFAEVGKENSVGQRTPVQHGPRTAASPAEFNF